MDALGGREAEGGKKKKKDDDGDLRGKGKKIQKIKALVPVELS